MPTFTLTFEEQQSYFLANVLEWLYKKHVPRVDNDTVWNCLELLNILSIHSLENIIFQYVEQRVTQFQEHFPSNSWKIYIKNTAFKRPSFLRSVLKTYFIDCNAKDAIEKYEVAKDIILSQVLNQDIGYLIMDVVPFQDLSSLEIKYIVKENLAPQALSLLEKMDSGIDIEKDTEDQIAIEELRNQLHTSSIANKPTEILSLASEEIEYEEECEKEIVLNAPQLRNIRLSTSQTLKAASEKLFELLDNHDEPISKTLNDTTPIDPNNSLVYDNSHSDMLKNSSKKTVFGFRNFTKPSTTRRSESFLLERRSNSHRQGDFRDLVPSNVQFIPSGPYDPIKRNRTRSNVPTASTTTTIEDESLRRNRSFSTNPILDEETTSSDFNYSMYSLDDPESGIPPDEEHSESKRVGILDLIKGFF